MQSRAPAVKIDGVQFAAAGDVYYGGSASGTALGTARVRVRVDSMPGTGFKILAGANNGGGTTGWLVCTEDTIGGAAVGQLVVYAGISGSLTRLARKFLMPADIGRVFTIHIVCDGSKAWVYIDGRRSARGVTATTVTGSTQILNIDGRANGTFSNGAVTVIDVAEGTTALTPSEVLADAGAAPGSSFSGQTHRYTASPSVGATWSDEVGAISLTRAGSPSPINFTPTYGNHVGAMEIWGDSIALGRQESPALTSGDGWVREFQRTLSSTYGKACTLLGHTFPSNGTLDYDHWRSCVGGEDLNARLATLATDLASNGPPDAATILAYGVNDIVAKSRTAAQLQADVTTAVGLINTARPGRPIFVCNVMDVATASATLAQRTEIDTYQSGFAAMIATLQGTYSQVRGIDYSTVVTNPDDVTQLFDGTHPTVATYSAIANIVAPIVAANM